jgi:RimJ/RimL family protein N-acetyltransferase
LRYVLPERVETERLLLRTWSPDDAEALAEIYQQAGYLEHMPPGDAVEHVERFITMWEVEGFGKWAACDRTNGRLIGRIGLMRHHDWPLVDDPVEVGWVLHEGYWGRGLATEGARAAVDAWLTYLDDDVLFSFTVPQNTRSRAVMERLGMTLGGSTVWRGLEHVWYALERAGKAP